MTISVDTNKQTYTGDDSTTVFNSVFKIFDDDDIKVEVVTNSTSAVSVKVKNTDYTVSTITSPSSAVNITFTTAPASGTTVVLRRSQPRTQSTDLVENDNLPAQTLENDTDKVVMMIQELKEEIDRCIKLDPSQTLSTYVAALSGNTGKALAVNSAEDGFEYTNISDLALDIDGLVAATPASSDTFAFYDASESGNRKVTLANLATAIDHDNLTNFVADEHINWTSTNRNFSTTGTAATGALTVTGAIAVSSTVDGRDIATDGTKLDGIEALADVTDEANVTDALDGATLTAATVAGTDKVLIQDADDSDILKTATAQSIADLSSGGLSDIVDDTTPQLGGNLDVNGNKIVSTSNGNIDIEPNGTGNVLLGNMTFDADQTIGAGQDNYVLTYDDGAGVISLEAAAGGGGGDMVLADVQTVTGAKTFNSGTLKCAGATSGTTTVNATAVAGTTTLTLPAATDTLVGKATTDTLTNKTIDTASNTITVVEADISDLGSYITASSTDTLTNKTFDANGTGNSLSNVDVADLANGTDGELITWSAAGAPTTVAVGTSGHVLTSNGAGAAPTFQAPAGGGDWTLISSSTASASASISFTGLSSTYVAYRIVISNLIAATDAVALWLRTSTDNGSTYDSGASDYKWVIDRRYDASTSVRTDLSDSQIRIIDNGSGFGLGNAAGEHAHAEVTIFDPSDSGIYTGVQWTGWYEGGTPDTISFHGGGARLSAADVDAIQFQLSSGNITSGKFHLYGLSAS